MPRYMGEEEVIKMNEAIANERIYTVEDMEKLPDDIHAELIDGRFYYMAPPTKTHQGLVTFLTVSIGNHIRDNKGTCRVYPAPFALYLDQDSETYLVPDLMVVCDMEKLDEKGCHGGPDIVMEIVSPSSRDRDYLLKLRKYHDAGVKEYWILDTDRKSIIVYNFENETTKLHGFQDKVASGVLENLDIDFQEFDEL